MAEEWMQKLAQDLAEKDRGAAKEIKHREHNERIISEQAKPFFVTFAECFKHMADEMEGLLGAQGLQAQQVCKVESNGCTVTLSRAKLPFINATATFQPQSHEITVSYTVCNPELPKQGASGKNPQSRFDVSHDDKVYVVLDGRDFHEPKEAAEFLMELLFTVSDCPK